MSDNPSSALSGAEGERRPRSQRSRASTRSKVSKASRLPDEERPLLGENVDNRNYGDTPLEDDAHSAAASSLRSLRDEASKKNKPWRWPSIVALSFLSLVILAILGLGFAAPAVVEEYAKEAMVFEPTSLSIDSFTSTGVIARVQGDFTLDGSKVQKKPVRDLGRAGTWIARKVESKESKVEVFLPQYDNLLLGTALVPPIVVNVRDGVTTHIDILCNLKAGDLNGLRQMANAWLQGRIGNLSVRGVAEVPLTSGIFGLGTQSLAKTIVFAGNELPTLPQYKFKKLNFYETDLQEAGEGMAADALIIVTNDYPVSFAVPSLAFNILVQACSSDLPYISLADAATQRIQVEPKEDFGVQVKGVIRKLPDTLTSACPNIQKSPLDVLVGDYIRGEDTTVYVRGSDHSIDDTPSWVTDFIKDIIVPVSLPGESFEELIRSFSLEDVHFGLPNPFAGPDSPDSKPRVSANVKAVINVPEEMNFNIDISRVRADADIYHKGKKLGKLDLHQWQKAKSERIEASGNIAAGLVVSSIVKDAPIDISDNDVFAEIVQAMIFGGKKIILEVKAAVDVETETVLGKLVVRDIPGEGKVYVNPISGGKNGTTSFKPAIGSIRILDTTKHAIKLKAKVNITNPTEYSAMIPYASIKLLSNGTEIGYANTKDINITRGINHNVPIEATFEPHSKLGLGQGRELLSQYISGYNTTITLKTYEGTIPTQPSLGRALSNLSIDMPTPSLHTPKNPSKPDEDRDPNAPTFIDDATFHILTSTASFTLLSPLEKNSIFITFINATAFYNHTEAVGGILYDLPWEVPPGVSISPDLPVNYDLLGVGYEAVKAAVGGRLKLDAKAHVSIRIGQWEEKVWVVGRGIGACIKLL